MGLYIGNDLHSSNNHLEVIEKRQNGHFIENYLVMRQLPSRRFPSKEWTWVTQI
jgi:hypothetical protein